ncbi:MAG: glycine-rich domain-containing protein [Arenicella sp.]
MDKSKFIWEALQKLTFSEAGADLTFAQRLARENGWTQEYAERSIQEYKRFIYLIAIGDQPMTPSDQVDQVWHLHLTYTRSYWHEMCRDILGFELHHGPTKGGKQQASLFFEQYTMTLGSYQKVFGEQAPADIWPSAKQRFKNADQFLRVNKAKKWVLPKPKLSAVALFAAMPLTLAACSTTDFFLWDIISKMEPAEQLFLAIGVLVIILGSIYTKIYGVNGKGGGCGGGGDIGCSDTSGCSGCGGCGG